MTSNRPLSVRTTHAGLWVVGGKLFSKALDFVSLLILARFLGPREFGLVAMAMTSVQIVEAISEMPLAAVLLNQKKPTDSMYDTALTLAVLRSVGIVTVLSLLSWPMATLYHEPRLIALQCALAFAPAMRGLVSSRMTEFARVFDFRRDVILEIIAKAGSLAISATLAITTGSYWAIAVGTISTTAVMMIASYFFAPQRFRLDLGQWRLFADMIGWSTAGQILSAVNWQTDKMVLPRFVDTPTYGHFASADNLISIPYQAIVVPITRPLYSAFVAVRESGDIGSVYLKSSTGIFSVVGPVWLMIAVLAHPIVRLILGPQWIEAAPILTWLASTAITLLPAVTLPALAMALNRTRIAFIRLAVEFCIKVPLIVILASQLQLQGVLIGHTISSIIMFIVSLFLVKHLTGLSAWAQIKSLLRPLASMLATLLFLLAVSRLFAPDASALSNFLNLTWVCATALLIFAAVNLTLWKIAGCPDGYESLGLKMVRKIVGR